ncbi:hypothetical protein I302_105343 [Kwoniella bestiolae CBS 10118]|uniref:Protein CPL1-like domain-containing protein n=1 Tax=Kwoniella bestiolae CBS 10118 TaxID=1296100 RepID=A0A1B9FSV0_9TREE|nr:hypothetical protein I302_08630 [Kwoniella bestiolae CBS 10118]OCF21851.1 hypothetical protein I302_08630 [Kwoniella bestiolae CBS 10118]
MTSSLAYLGLLVILLTLSQANILRLGCYPSRPGGDVLLTNDFMSVEDCAAGCSRTYKALYALAYQYEYWNAELQQSDIRSVCLCGDTLGPTLPGWTYLNGCPAINYPWEPESVTEVWLLQTTFTRLGCGGISDYEERSFTEVDEFENCFAQCRDSEYAYVDRLTLEVGLRCSCSNEPVHSIIDNCQGADLQGFNWMIFQHPPGSSGAPSAWVKRQLKERLEKEAGLRAMAVCPQGLTACRTSPGDDSSFECLDTQSELESCGGCIHGVLGQSDDMSKADMDCSSISGVAPDGVTCLSGQCLAFACEEGYNLKSNQCLHVG